MTRVLLQTLLNHVVKVDKIIQVNNVLSKKYPRRALSLSGNLVVNILKYLKAYFCINFR